MPSGIAITNTGSTPEDPAAMARKCKEAGQARRLRAMARVMEGELGRGEIAREAGVGRQTLCDWACRYNAEGAGGLRDRPRSGRPPLLGKAERAEVKVWLEEGPEPGAPSWTLKSLKAADRGEVRRRAVAGGGAAPGPVDGLPQAVAAADPSEGRPPEAGGVPQQFQGPGGGGPAGRRRSGRRGPVFPGRGKAGAERDADPGPGPARQPAAGAQGLSGTATAACSRRSARRPAGRSAASAAGPTPTR